MAVKYTGISFPFRLSSKGGVQLSSLSESSVARQNEAILQRILTKRFERTMEFHIYSRLHSVIFDSIDDSDIPYVKYLVKEAIHLETRITVKDEDITVTIDQDNNSFSFDIHYLLNDFGTYHDFSFGFELGGEY
jgi:phage baseplate assembly protein W